ncbi:MULTISPECIES: hypothetical protein [Parageobacillus]|uniref:Uncharacterized protein n=1 Tax=Parageobacillus thermantarcticus TaxID=186116 RepID=A0A1I0TVE9_9BACL|nr:MULTISPECIES: hypothetical protein [Parageobacillus]AEH46643.1 hypothetical protein Geoth_0633 [Parageobacillus thermoglucosidasius C56-YS93]SFA54906.1 hypothetical protein SAMN05192569_10565 [Parageobacillus thermantarcticus]
MLSYDAKIDSACDARYKQLYESMNENAKFSNYGIFERNSGKVEEHSKLTIAINNNKK